jgi:hypothetical protein
MVGSRCKVKNSIKQGLIDYVRSKIECKYMNDFGDVVILATEEYRLKTNSKQMGFMVFHSQGEDLRIDIIGGGGGIGLLGFSWGTESSFISKVRLIIHDYAREFNGDFVDLAKENHI